MTEPVDFSRAREANEWALIEELIRGPAFGGSLGLSSYQMDQVCAAARPVFLLNSSAIELVAPVDTRPELERLTAAMRKANSAVLFELVFAYAQLVQAGIEPLSVAGLRGPALRLV